MSVSARALTSNTWISQLFLAGRSGAEAILILVLALGVAALAFAVFVAAAGANPGEVFYSLYLGAFGTAFSWQNTLQRAAPFMLTALCTAIPARFGLLIIGNEGALVIGGLAAAILGLLLIDFGALVALSAMALAGATAGGLWIAAVAWLRQYRGVNETIASLLMNYLAIALLLHLVSGPLRDPESLNKPSTAPIGASHMLGQMPGLDVHWGLVYGLVACALVFVAWRYTTFGFAAQMIGGNPAAARLNGLPVGRFVLLGAFGAGAAAGLAGMVEVAAVHGRANESLVVGYGYVGILVAFLARQNPVLIIPAAILIGGIEASGGLLQRRFDLPDATVAVLQGMVFLSILVSETLRGRLFRRTTV